MVVNPHPMTQTTKAWRHMMMKRRLTIGAVVLMAVLIAGAVAVWALPGNMGAGSAAQTRLQEPSAPAVSDASRPSDSLVAASGDSLSAAEVEALQMALDDEYEAWSVYDQVIADLGAVRPFTSIQRAEENHIAALVTLFDRYGLDVPANEWPGNVPTFDTLASACTAGVQAEIDNADLYDELLSMVEHPDLVQVFTTLQQASATKQLPAFERCAP
jgi:hypothetical protein